MVRGALTIPLSLDFSVKIKKTPYMKIYLCGAELPAELIGSATWAPLIPPVYAFASYILRGSPGIRSH